MKIAKFDIEFDSPQAVYIVGSSVSGNVHLQLSEPMKIKYISLKVEGKCRTYFERYGQALSRYNAKFKGEEDYFTNTVILFKAPGESSVEYPAGSHVYPFSLTLEEDLPSSFEGAHGFVRYTCRATISKSWNFENTKRILTVLRHLDLNDESLQASLPAIDKKDQFIRSGCCDEGNIKIHTQLNKTGYVPGEHMFCSVAVTNESDKEINGITIRLKQKATFYGHTFIMSENHYKQSDTKYFDIFRGSEFHVAKRGSEQMSTTYIVPSLPPSDLASCKIIDIKHTIVVEFSCGMADVKTETGFIIGTIPTRVVPVITQPPSYATAAPPAEGEFSVIPSAPTPVMEEPPPSYAEYVLGQVSVEDDDDDEHTGGDRSWVPIYPYYDYSASSRPVFADDRSTQPIHNEVTSL